jgi:hypothetical protein
VTHPLLYVEFWKMIKMLYFLYGLCISLSRFRAKNSLGTLDSRITDIGVWHSIYVGPHQLNFCKGFFLCVRKQKVRDL